MKQNLYLPPLQTLATLLLWSKNTDKTHLKNTEQNEQIASDWIPMLCVKNSRIVRGQTK